MANTDLVSRFARTMAVGLANRSQEPAVDVWPSPRADLTSGDLHSAPVLLPRIGNAFALIGNDRGIAEAHLGPSRLAHFMYLFLQNPLSPTDARRRIDTAVRLLEAIGELRNGDIFTDDQKNLVFKDWHRYTPDVSSDALTTRQARNIGVLSGALSTYCEYLYFAHLAYGRELHGPYNLGDGRKLIVRDFYDLRPPHWEFASSLGFSFLRIYLVVRDIDVIFDFTGRMTTTGAIPQHSEAVMVDVDGMRIGIEEAVSLIPGILSTVERAKEESLALSEGELLTQWVRGQFWAAKPLFDLAGLPNDWLLPEDLVSQLNSTSGPSWLTRRFAGMAGLTHAERIGHLERLFQPGVMGK